MTKRDSIASKAIYSCKEQNIMESQDRQHYEGTLDLISNFPISTYESLFADQRKFCFDGSTFYYDMNYVSVFLGDNRSINFLMIPKRINKALTVMTYLSSYITDNGERFSVLVRYSKQYRS